MRENPAGWVSETWYCRGGCRRYFTVQRNTMTNEIRGQEAS
jgi:heterotetrameric sarcosine oxidase delta subunit